ncbi:L,D-transpeptidase family protein [Chelatococcus asaccharovorans]|uniref:Murein L,D-transpeptidase YcbB/YkuD n=1 Tax=Chelatococcus asaccharovorans TaxID=28210 RepID=A0A2V3U568_9HYPH|nr:murein L,D-transpeptidase YcbB/YkuD [Chelatococcus asaccharovorans]CAH1668653.1 Murein L,D-transpeptidase YcbB/YkuD [Chelatococcus asaccharovorans]CAH1679932.1 Murein L,D-transpeptidase YcbB/YkuD [Chelatococcus asaccharovorans]
MSLRYSLSNVGLLAATLGVTSVAAVELAQAQQVALGSQAEWVQSYDAASSMRLRRSNTPTLSAEAVAATEAAIAQYRDIVNRGGWGQIQGRQTLKVGVRSPAVVALRQRLTISGDLSVQSSDTDIFDSYVEAAVKRFQGRHGLAPTGVVNASTIAAMNVPAQVRLQQLETNLVRLRSLSGNLGQRYVIVNIPAAQVETVENGHVATRHAAGVGKIDRQSPIMNAKITQVNFNPFWTVPASIIRKDLIPKMRTDPSYLSDQKIRVFNGQGQEVPPQSINWNSNDATRFMFRQDPGADLNSMGMVRINIPNPHGVYMHDTPSKGVFGDDFRFVSSGCVRVQNVRDYITWLLKDTPGWDRSRIEAAIASGDRIDATITSPVPVYWTYITSWATSDGAVQFRDDIYNRDGLNIAKVMNYSQIEEDVDATN